MNHPKVWAGRGFEARHGDFSGSCLKTQDPGCGSACRTLALAISCFLLLGWTGFAQIQRAAVLASDSQEERPTQYVLPVIEEGARQAYEDFVKLVKQKSWSRAFRSIQEQNDNPPEGLMPGRVGEVAVAWRERVFMDYLALGTDARRAFRLFYDPSVENGIKQAEALKGQERREKLLHLYWTGFLSSSGDDVAWLLACDAMVEKDHRRAAHYLSMILEHHADSNLERPMLWVALCNAQAKMGDLTAYEDSKSYALDRYGDELVEIHLPGHESLQGLVTDVLQAIDKDVSDPSGVGERVDVPSVRPLEGEAEWMWSRKNLLQGPAGKAKKARKGLLSKLFGPSEQEVKQARARGEVEPGMRFIPASAISEDRILVNRAGKAALVDLHTGEVIWASRRKTAQEADSYYSRYIATYQGGYFFSTSGPAGSGNRFFLECHDPKSSAEKPVWSTARSESMRKWDFIGRPLVHEGHIYILSSDGEIKQVFLAVLKLASGEFVRRIDLGTPVRASSGNHWFPNNSQGWNRASPGIAIDQGQVIVMTDGGAVCAVDLGTNKLSWAFPYDYKQSRPCGVVSPGKAQVVGGLVLARSQGSKRLIALDCAARSVAWERSVRSDTHFVGIDENNFYVLGAELEAIGLEDLRLKWSRRLTGIKGWPSVVVLKDRILVANGRGIKAYDKASGDELGELKIPEIRKAGATLHLTPNSKLICIGVEFLGALDLSE